MRKLDANTREQFRRKPLERLDDSHVPSAKLSDAKGRYKIKLRSVGYRLVYEVHDAVLFVIVVAIGRRSRNDVYETAQARTDTVAVAAAVAEKRDSSASQDTALDGKPARSKG